MVTSYCLTQQTCRPRTTSPPQASMSNRYEALQVEPVNNKSDDLSSSEVQPSEDLEVQEVQGQSRETSGP